MDEIIKFIERVSLFIQQETDAVIAIIIISGVVILLIAFLMLLNEISKWIKGEKYGTKERRY
jgi:hypothetical protein